MRSAHLQRRLSTAYQCILTAAKIDGDRAALEAGGYLRVLSSDSLGRTLMKQWAMEFRGGLHELREIRVRLIENLRALASILRKAAQSLADDTSACKLLESLDALDAAVSKQWLGGNSLDFGIQMVIAGDPLSDYADRLVRCAVELHVLGIALPRSALSEVFKTALDAEDPGELGGWIEPLRETIQRALRSADACGATLTNRSRMEQVLGQDEPAPEVVIEALTGWLPETIGELGEEASFYTPGQFSWFRWLGGLREVVVRKLSLAPGPRTAWWSLVTLNSLAQESSLTASDLAYDDPMLRQIAEAVLTGQQDHPLVGELQQLAGIPPATNSPPATARLTLDAHKVHATAMENIESGGLIMADLLRYRQRVEWYSRADLERQISDAGQKKKVAAREAAAVRHLAAWLVDQGYLPVAKQLGVDRTDLEGADDHGNFVIEAKLLTPQAIPKRQVTLDKRSRKWGTQAAAYAGVQAVSVAVVVVFNQSEDVLLEGGGPYSVGDVNVFYVPVNITRSTASKKGSAMTLRYLT